MLSLKHDSLKIYIWNGFWSCSFVKTLLAVWKSPSNSKQRQGTFQVSRGAASPALSLILTGKIAEWALLAFSFHFPLLLSPSLFPKPSKYPNFHLPRKASTPFNCPCPSVSLNQHIVFWSGLTMCFKKALARVKCTKKWFYCFGYTRWYILPYD